MNKTKRPVDVHVSKRNKKELRLAPAPQEDPVVRSDKLTVSAALKKLPPKVAKKAKSAVKSTLKGMAVKKAKKLVKHSKRTNPGQKEDLESSPRSPHIEGVRWIKAVQKQTKSRTRTLDKRMAKKR